MGIKAILAVKGNPYKFVLHAVMDVSDDDDAGPWAEGERKINKIVFIGKAMDQRLLRQRFDEIFSEALPSAESKAKRQRTTSEATKVVLKRPSGTQDQTRKAVGKTRQTVAKGVMKRPAKK